ncbi:MAG TPA: VIT domain-containing protein [Verrucomicrobiae bacterium]|nr:VIT domain-containing protein [Verrucomicrobiae bacterium]
MKRSIVTLALLGFLGTGLFARGAGMIIVEDSSMWPDRVLPQPMPPWPPERPHWRPHAFSPLEVESVKVRTKINDQVAVTRIDQEFFNPNPSRLEGTFVFPVPKGAHLDKFNMEIDGKQVEAELLGAEKARGIYEGIVRKLRDPALLEYAGQDVFKVRIFPIEPNSRKRVSFSYTQLLKSDAGLIDYTLPLSTEKFSRKPVKNVVVEVNLQVKNGLKSIYSPTHSVEIKRDGRQRASATFEGSNVSGESDFQLYFAAEKDELGVNLLAHRAEGEDGYFLLLASPGLELGKKEVIPKDVAFVLDTSGSMAGKKLDQAKKALQFCVENLNEDDRFEIIRFSTEVEPLFEKLTEANKQNRERAEDFVSHLRPMGATAIDDALRKALALRSDRSETRPFVVIFLTDGCPTIGVTDEDRIVANVQKESDGKARIFCFGIGTDVNTHLLDKITEQTRGFSQYVLPEEDLEIKVSTFFSRIKEPVLANPELKFNGDARISKLYPARLPDLFNGDQLVIVGRYSGHGDSGVVLEGNVRGGHRKFGYDVRFPEISSENDFLPRLWATRRIGYLLDEIRLHGENSELKDEVTDLARKYGVVTPYTAYLIVEDEQRREVPLAVRSMPRLQEDVGARHEAEKSWRQFTTEPAGDVGVASAMSGLALRSADAPAAAAMSADAAFGRRYGLAAGGMPAQGLATQTAPPETSTLARYTQQSQFVAGKTFFLNGNQWVDSELQKAREATRVRVQFGSREYFDLLALNGGFSSWLSLGDNLQILWRGVVYEIHD